MNHGRHVGVRVPHNQSTEQAPVMTVTRVSRGEELLVEYGDERGIKHTVRAVRFGDKVFLPPNSAQWTESHRSFSKEINNQIIAKLDDQTSRSATGGSIPSNDSVNIMGGESLTADASLGKG